MADQENKLGIIYSTRDEQLVTVIKDRLKPLETNAALSFWPHGFAIENYSSNLQQAKEQLTASKLFIILWSPELTNYVENRANGINPYQEYVKPILQKAIASKVPIFSILVRSNEDKTIELTSSVIIPKVKVLLTTYFSPEEVLYLELSSIENAIYRDLLSKRIPFLPKEKSSFLEDNLYGLTQYLISDNSDLFEKALKLLIDGDIDQLLSIIKNKKTYKELTDTLKQVEEERNKQNERKIRQKKSIFLPILEAKLLTLKGNNIEAEKRYEQAHQLDPKNLNVLEGWRDLLTNEGEFDKAEKIDHEIENAIILLEKDGNIAHRNGVFFFNKGRLKIAEEWLLKALKIRKKLADKSPLQFLPECAYTLHFLGILYDRWERVPDALKYLHEALAMRKGFLENEERPKENEHLVYKGYAKTLEWLGQLYSLQEKPEKGIWQAINYYKEAIKIRMNKLSKKDDDNIKEISGLLTSVSGLYEVLHEEEEAEKWKNEASQYSFQLVWRGQKLSKQVFISFSSEDESTVNSIQESLHGYGIKANTYLEGRQPGDSIKKYIEDQIQDTDFTLLIVSQDSLLSPWVAIEMTKARKLGKEKLIPCYIDKSFLEIDFADRAWEKIEVKKNKILQLIEDRGERDRRTNDLDARLTLLERLESGLTDTLKYLGGIGVIPLTEDNFKKGIERIAEKILNRKSIFP